MKLFKLKYNPPARKHCQYNDTILYDGVVRAKDEDSARKEMSESSCDEGTAVWFDASLVSCEEILVEGEQESILIGIAYSC